MINNITLIGRICNDLELRVTNNGKEVVSFCLAVDRTYTPKGQEKKADFIDCVAFTNNAKFINQYFHKGDMIALTGELHTENYTDKDGNKRKSINVIVNNVSFCGGKKESNEFDNPAPSYASANDNSFEDYEDDETLPF